MENNDEVDANSERLAAALRELEERFSKAFHVSPIGNILVRHSDATIVEINAAYLNMLGYIRSEDREAARQRGVRDFIQKPDTIGELGLVLKRLFE